MSNKTRIGGIVYLNVNGEQLDVKGNFSYGHGQPKREAVVGQDGVHGHTAKPQVPFVEGEITDRADLDVKALLNVENATVTLELYNGKTFVLRDAWQAGAGEGNTEEGNLEVRFEGLSGEEI